MERDGHLKSLAERMKKKAEQERMQAEEIFNERLRSLSASLTASSQNALTTMSDAMEREITDAAGKLSQHYRTLSIAYGKAWIRTAIMALAALIGLTVGGWTLAKAGAWNLGRYRTELTQLKRDCQERRETLATLKSETWDLELQTLKNGRFRVFPFGKKPDSQIWTVDGRSAIKMEE